MRLSMPLSAAIGVSGSARLSTTRPSTFTSMPPSLTRSSCLSWPVTVTKRALREARDRVGDLVGLAGLGEHVGRRAGADELDGAGLVAEDDELHLLLVADRVDPSGHRHGAVGEGREVADEGAFDHGARVYRDVELSGLP